MWLRFSAHRASGAALPGFWVRGPSVSAFSTTNFPRGQNNTSPDGANFADHLIGRCNYDFPSLMLFPPYSASNSFQIFFWRGIQVQIPLRRQRETVMKITPTNDAALPSKSRMIGYLVPSVIRAARPRKQNHWGKGDAPHLASVFPVDKCAGTGTQIHDSICPVSVAFNCRMMAADCLGVRGELKVRLLVAHRNIKSANGEAFTGLDIYDDLGGSFASLRRRKPV